jgi:hypothetical protein
VVPAGREVVTQVADPLASVAGFVGVQPGTETGPALVTYWKVTVPVGVPAGLGLLTVAVIVTDVPEGLVEGGLADVVTVVVPRANAGDSVKSAMPATINTDAAPIETTERILL